ncbi:hypothetical protein O181_056479 [Austropuccinia psidii MF-1]|uniref:Uncharacterized protein n=1 Tax=Austropuccinia psidii MF-1 TaxID=1389203 RepID=A0A9Q3E8J4_9BASI|nr:hypothetical protein [Austropuccinia psidii MF-1]
MMAKCGVMGYGAFIYIYCSLIPLRVTAPDVKSTINIRTDNAQSAQNPFDVGISDYLNSLGNHEPHILPFFNNRDDLFISNKDKEISPNTLCPSHFKSDCHQGQFGTYKENSKRILELVLCVEICDLSMLSLVRHASEIKACILLIRSMSSHCIGGDALNFYYLIYYLLHCIEILPLGTRVFYYCEITDSSCVILCFILVLLVALGEPHGQKIRKTAKKTHSTRNWLLTTDLAVKGNDSQALHILNQRSQIHQEVANEYYSQSLGNIPVPISPFAYASFSVHKEAFMRPHSYTGKELVIKSSEDSVQKKTRKQKSVAIDSTPCNLTHNSQEQGKELPIAEKN